MAASMARFMKPKCFTSCTNKSPLQLYRSTASCTYVLLPEVPPDTAQTNTLMDVENLPKFSEVTPASVFRACGKLSILMDTEFSDHVDYLSDFGQKSTFEDIFDPIEKLSVPLHHALKTVKQLSTVKKKTFTDAYEGTFTHAAKSRQERFTKETLYHKIKELNAHPEELTEAQQSLVNLYLKEAKLLGTDLTGKDKYKFADFYAGLTKSEDEFRRNVYYASRKYSVAVYSPNDISEMPTAVRNKLSLNKDNPEEGPWRFGTDSASIYKPALAYCSNRNTRKELWRHLVNVSSNWHTTQGIHNKLIIDNIRYERKTLATILGHSTWSDMVLEHSMAGGVANVMEFLETLRSAFQPEAQKEAESLHVYATAQGFDDSIKMWDVEYFARKQRDELFEIDENVSDYFPLPRVLHALFQICNGLFGVDIKQREFGSTDVWHPSVHVYDMYEGDGTHKGTFYLDPYARIGEKYGGNWIEPGRLRSGQFSSVPISFVNLNLTPSLGSKPALLDFSQVSDLFSMFGHTLQQLLTTVEYSDISGQSNIELDSLMVSSTFMNMWLMRPDTLKSVSCHWETNQPLPDSQVSNIIGAFSHRYSSRMMKKLFMSVYDLEMHFSDTHFDTAVKRLWPRYMLYPLDKDYAEYCSMVQIFADRRMASYQYSFLWNEMVAADVMKSFNECDNLEELQAMGRRYKETFLSLGGSVPSAEVFRRFKGHDPSISSLLQMRLPSSNTPNNSEASET